MPPRRLLRHVHHSWTTAEPQLHSRQWNCNSACSKAHTRAGLGGGGARGIVVAGASAARETAPGGVTEDGHAARDSERGGQRPADTPPRSRAEDRGRRSNGRSPAARSSPNVGRRRSAAAVGARSTEAARSLPRVARCAVAAGGRHSLAEWPRWRGRSTCRTATSRRTATTSGRRRRASCATPAGATRGRS